MDSNSFALARDGNKRQFEQWCIFHIAWCDKPTCYPSCQLASADPVGGGCLQPAFHFHPKCESCRAKFTAPTSLGAPCKAYAKKRRKLCLDSLPLLHMLSTSPDHILWTSPYLCHAASAFGLLLVVEA